MNPNKPPLVVKFPDVTIDCPCCYEKIALNGYEFEPTINEVTFGEVSDVYCDACDHEFDVIIGGES